MLNKKRMFLVVIIGIVLTVTWLFAITMGTRQVSKQRELIEKAQVFIDDEIYINAIPLLKKASDIKYDNTLTAVKLLAESYRIIGEESKATSVLKETIDKGYADEEIYQLVAEEYLPGSRYKKGLEILKQGIEKLKSEKLANLYEQNCYRYNKAYSTFEELGTYSNGYLAAKQDGKWGYINARSDTQVDFTFDKVTQFDKDYATAVDNGKIVLIDKNGYRNAVCHEESATDVSPISNGITAVKVNDKWHMANYTFSNVGKKKYDFIGKISDNRRAVCINGKWLLFNEKNDAVTPEYDEIKLDNNGNAFAQERAFAKENDIYFIIDAEGNRIGQTFYEDVKPFIDGWAAVKKNGKWCFIDSNGEEKVNGNWEEAESFSCGLAAVKQNGLWGYLSTSGKIVIDFQFAEATSFYEGVASVKTESGWSVLRLKRYEN